MAEPSPLGRGGSWPVCLYLNLSEVKLAAGGGQFHRLYAAKPPLGGFGVAEPPQEFRVAKPPPTNHHGCEWGGNPLVLLGGGEPPSALLGLLLQRL